MIKFFSFFELKKNHTSSLSSNLMVELTDPNPDPDEEED